MMKNSSQPVSINTIREPIASEMQIFEERFMDYVRTDVMLLDKIMGYIVRSKGKQIRPMFVFLMAGAHGGINDASHRGAALIELLHTATLVHDDVVDDSNERRGFFSINALWKNKISVLVGDYLLSRGLLLSVDNNDFALLRLVTQAVREMSEGELLQMEKARSMDITEAVYFEIIRQKTATLLEACCGVGAASAGANAEQIADAKLFGRLVGIAFQIKDDLFDYGTAQIGKPLGIDIKEKKMTLPLIYALNQAQRSEKRHYINLIKNKSHQNEVVQAIIQFVKASGGIDYTIQKMNEYKTNALNYLQKLPPTPFLNALYGLVDYVIQRDK